MSETPLGQGRCSSFGGPKDTGVGQFEGLGLIEDNDREEWFFDRVFIPQTTMALARLLDPDAFYCAMRFAYTTFQGVRGEILPGYSRDQIRRGLFVVTFNYKSVFAQAVDWGPNLDTGRLIDCSPGTLAKIGAKTDDMVSVVFVEA